MGKSLFIAEKPSVAREFGKALKYTMTNHDGYMESKEAVVTWCVGHLVTMSYPEVYREELKKWTLSTLPFIPDEYLYEIIPASAKQFTIVSGLLNRKDVDTIYVCTDSGREGEYIYRLVEQMANVSGKTRKRVWIDSQTEAEILRGIREAKDLSEYDDLADAAYLRAQEDYLMGINFSRVLTLRYGRMVNNYLKAERGAVAVGRVMTCVLGMVVRREREIRSFVKTPFYRSVGFFGLPEGVSGCIEGEWKASEGSAYLDSPLLYKENGFKERKDVENLHGSISGIAEGDTGGTIQATILKSEKKTEKKNPPLLYNLAELQNECSKLFKISPDDTLKIAQELYEKKLTTYPRTDARVLSSAVAKEISTNLRGLSGYSVCRDILEEVSRLGNYKTIGKTKYVNDKMITDHYAIIPTGSGLNNLPGLSVTAARVYEIIVRRFLAIFLPSAVYMRLNMVIGVKSRDAEHTESYYAGFKVMTEEGYRKALEYSFSRSKDPDKARNDDTSEKKDSTGADEDLQEMKVDAAFLEKLQTMKKGTVLSLSGLQIKEGETSPPKRYNSGSMILAMENAGQLIEDEEMRALIKGSGIGTSATRAGILTKLVSIQYLHLNKKTQIITPTLRGEMVFDVVRYTIGSLLDPKLTASWEKGLSGVANGTIKKEEYREKLNSFVTKNTEYVKQLSMEDQLMRCFDYASGYYKK